MCGLGRRKGGKEAIPERGSVEHRERGVKWHGHGVYYHCIKGKARTSKR